jgi:hypothetical protein
MAQATVRNCAELWCNVGSAPIAVCVDACTQETDCAAGQTCAAGVCICAG